MASPKKGKVNVRKKKRGNCRFTNLRTDWVVTKRCNRWTLEKRNLWYSFTVKTS